MEATKIKYYRKKEHTAIKQSANFLLIIILLLFFFIFGLLLLLFCCCYCCAVESKNNWKIYYYIVYTVVVKAHWFLLFVAAKMINAPCTKCARQKCVFHYHLALFLLRLNFRQLIYSNNLNKYNIKYRYTCHMYVLLYIYFYFSFSFSPDLAIVNTESIQFIEYIHPISDDYFCNIFWMFRELKLVEVTSIAFCFFFYFLNHNFQFVRWVLISTFFLVIIYGPGSTPHSISKGIKYV